MRIVDAEFTVVRGAYRAGDPHPTRRGWFFTGRRDAKGNWLWYRPPGAVSRWVRRIGMAVWLAMVALGAGAVLATEALPALLR